MYYVYILFSEKDSKLYTGYTHNLKSRLQRHQNGFVIQTRNRRPLRLIHYETYLEESDAKRREIFLKGGKGKAELKIQLQNCFAKIGYHPNKISTANAGGPLSGPYPRLARV